MFLRSGKNTAGNSNQNTNKNSEKSNQNFPQIKIKPLQNKIF